MEGFFTKEGHSIFTFKKGDIIIRLKPAAIMHSFHNANLSIDVDVKVAECNNFRSTPVEFIAVENNVIYVRELSVCQGLPHKIVYKLLLERYSEDWGLFVVPDGLMLIDCL